MSPIRVSRRSCLGSHVLAIVMVSTTTLSSRAAAEDDITGEWEVTMRFGNRDSFATLAIVRTPDGKLTGTWGRNEISRVKFDGGKLTFERTVRFGDNEFSMDYEGTLKDGKLEGSLSTDQGDFPASAVRKKAKSPALGQWNINFTVGDRDISAILSVTEGKGGLLEAQWTSSAGEHTVSDVLFKDGKLSFARKSKFDDFELESTYSGTVSADKLLGAIRSDRGDIAANGERAGAKLIGEWELTSETDRGPRTSTLTIYGDLTGRYEVFGGETPIQDLKLDGDQVSFRVELGFGDQTFNMDFKGKLDGSVLKGEIESPRGKREVTGKKTAPAITTPAVSAAGTWEILRETPNGTRTFTLKIKDDKTGTMTARDNTVDLEELRLEGDELSFKATLTFGDRDVTMAFKGKVDGKTLKGQFTTPRGTREATGKKVSE